MRLMNPTADELREQRKRLLARAHASSVAELRERAARGGLSAEEYLLWEEIKAIGFLLGENGDA
jgi:hypothetical protein